MSLVFEALRRNDDIVSPPQSTGSVLTAGRSLRKNRLWSILVWVLAGVLLGASYALFQPYASEFIQTNKQQLALPPIVSIPEQVQQVITAPVAALEAESPLILEPLDLPETPTTTAVVLPAIAPIVKRPTIQLTELVAETPTVTAPAPLTQKPPLSSIPSAAERVDQRQLLHRFNAAMSSEQTEQAAEILEDARKTLGPEHLMVLRMAGYYCVQQNCSDQARQAYQAILALLPGDKEAGYNLAVIEGRNGQLSQAHERVRQLLQNHPDDKALRSLQQTLHQERR